MSDYCSAERFFVYWRFSLTTIGCFVFSQLLSIAFLITCSGKQKKRNVMPESAKSGYKMVQPTNVAAANGKQPDQSAAAQSTVVSQPQARKSQAKNIKSPSGSLKRKSKSKFGTRTQDAGDDPEDLLDHTQYKSEELRQQHDQKTQRARQILKKKFAKADKEAQQKEGAEGEENEKIKAPGDTSVHTPNIKQSPSENLRTPTTPAPATAYLEKIDETQHSLKTQKMDRSVVK